MAEDAEVVDIPEDVINRSNELSNRIFNRAIEDCEDRDDVDLCGVIFGLFVNACHTLAAMGWPAEGLAKEALAHAYPELESGDGNISMVN